MSPSPGVTEVTPPFWRRLGPIHLIVLLGCMSLVGWNVVELRSWYGNRDQLTGLMVDLGLDEFNQTAMRRISREKSPHHAQLIAARTIVHQVMSPDLDERGLPIIPKEQRLQSLDRAEEMARRALQAESESWQASMLIGASIYLRRSLGADRRLVTESQDWEMPLRRAVDAAASKTEPRRILAAAYLETWPYLSPDKKILTRDLLTHVFRNDERALRRLIPVWLQLAESEEDALAVVPDDSQAWALVKYNYGRMLRWDAYAISQERLYDALEVELTADLDEAEQRKRLGDKAKSRELCLQVVAKAPRQMRFVPYVERALEVFPPGLQGIRSMDGISEWLQWAVDLDSVGLRPLSADIVDGLMNAAGPMESQVAAHAALLAENAYNVKRFEKQTAHKRTLSWSPFLLAKGRGAVARGELEDAEAALDALNLASRRSYLAWQVQARLASRRLEDETLEDDEIEAAEASLVEAETQMVSLEERRWSALGWNLQRQPTLFMVPAVSARGVRMEVITAGPQGDAVSVFLDGEQVALQAMYSGQHVELYFDIDKKPHLLQVESVSGQRTELGTVELLE